MDQMNRGSRPLSPFMIGPVYRPQITSVLSILHRITGVGLAVGAVLVVWWFLAAATDPDYFALVDGLLTSVLGGLILILSLIALWYHFFNGIRHLFWDVGCGFDLATVQRSGIAVLVATVAMTGVTLAVGWILTA